MDSKIEISTTTGTESYLVDNFEWTQEVYTATKFIEE
jgi:hypothetical protein